MKEVEALRTRLSICRRKRSFASAGEARLATEADGLTLYPYRCDRCGAFHLTSRSKGHRLPRPIAQTAK